MIEQIDPDLLDLMDEVMPQFEQKVVQGFAGEESKKFVNYVHEVLRIWSRTLEASGTGITYAGWLPVTPYERLAEHTRPMSNKRTFEIARNDYRMIKVLLKFEGRPLKTRFLEIPYFDSHGCFLLRDSRYHTVPTLTDHLFSIEDGSIFMPVTRARLTFNRQAFYYLADGCTESIDYYWAKLHHSKKNEAPKTRHPQILNYILAEHGLSETFRRYFNTEIIYGTDDTINDVDFPESEWVICSSAGTRPRSRIAAGSYEPPRLRVAIPREDYNNRVLKSAIGSIFYITDMCGVEEFYDYTEFDDPFMWKRVLSRFIWKTVEERDAIKHVEEHLDSIHQYLDRSVQRKLRAQNIEVQEINELFFFIMANFSNMTISNNVADMRNKRLSVVEEVMYPVRSMLFNIMFSIQRQAKARLKPDNIDRQLDREWKPKIMMTIASGHPEIQVIESTTDQKLFKIGRVVHIPSRSGGKSKSSEMTDPMFELHDSMIDCCSWAFITKASPSGRGSLNPFTPVDNEGRFIFRDEFEPWRQNIRDLS
ncbi:hypothetical protein [Vibrio phage vB_VmeM-Yong XC32]|nr:hypothetical protein [Vibrio phage vB_VmeM-Yong XC31]QAX96315.1 hypothetical protein [Vibrio phage vB_VmeM-Yong XC32]QAX96633.1 hypothetical protein [Vibrio phage vB_VmeM-Yong MS31]QAX96951.1 hypothetical protein [Vibrio phage vB_VmeM-Yong MS32]